MKHLGVRRSDRRRAGACSRSKNTSPPVADRRCVRATTQRALNEAPQEAAFRNIAAFAIALGAKAGAARLVSAATFTAPGGTRKRIVAQLSRLPHPSRRDRQQPCSPARMARPPCVGRASSNCEVMTLNEDEFIRRLLLHMLPKGSHLVRPVAG